MGLRWLNWWWKAHRLTAGLTTLAEVLLKEGLKKGSCGPRLRIFLRGEQPLICIMVYVRSASLVSDLFGTGGSQRTLTNSIMNSSWSSYSLTPSHNDVSEYTRAHCQGHAAGITGKAAYVLRRTHRTVGSVLQPHEILSGQSTKIPIPRPSCKETRNAHHQSTSELLSRGLFLGSALLDGIGTQAFN